MKTLITGASGFVGQHLVNFLGKEEDIICLGHQPNGDLPNYYSVDLTNSESLTNVPLDEVEAVFHLAGLAAVGASFDQPRRYIDTNAGMQLTLFEEFKKRGKHPRILIVSTGGVYGPSDQPLTETAELGTSNPYIISKLTQEMLGHYYLKLGFPVLIARPFNHIGPGQLEGFLVADLAKQIVEAELSNSGEIKAGNLDSKRDYTDVRDIVAAYDLIMKKGEPGEIYNVCSGRARSGKEILDTLVRLSRSSIQVTPDPSKMRPAEIKEITGSYTLLNEDTGWAPKIQLDETLNDVLNDWRGKLKP